MRAQSCAALLAVSVSAAAVERPVPSLNGNYRAEFQYPILFEGDTLWSGWGAYSSRASIPSPDPPSAINCTGSSGIENGEYVVRDAAGFAQISAATPPATVIRVCPGDYRGESPVDPQAQGTAWTAGNFYHVSCLLPDRTLTPYMQIANPSPSVSDGWATNHDPAVECLFPTALINDDPRYWLFQGITWHATTWSSNTRLIRVEHAQNIVFDRNWMDCNRITPNVGGSNVECIYHREGSGETVAWITIQNSVVGPCAPIWDADMPAVGRHEGSDHVYLVRSEVFNCQKGYFSGSNFAGGSGVGSGAEDTDFYRDSRLSLNDLGYSNSNWAATGLKGRNDANSITERVIDPTGAQSTLFDANGRFGCASQTQLSTKHGSSDPAQPLIFRANRVGGGRVGDSRCMDDGAGLGMAVSGQHYPQNSVIEANFIYDHASGMRWPSTNELNASFQNIIVRDNVIELSNLDTSPQVTDRFLMVFDTNCTSPCVEPVIRDFTWNHNSFVAPPNNGSIRAAPITISSRSNLTGTVACNVMHGSRGVASGPSDVTGFGNVEVDNADWSGITNLTGTETYTTAEAQNAPLCVWIKLITNPTQYCTSGPVAATDQSPYILTPAAGC